ncbi:ABC transporter substrate-binding protein [Arthrobacter gengyunqii]|uniref:ABC transporter substrate-binding protein n=1 Tax=Arthrobacter gengyunqii TaxID=2886940 RepID=A0A9X1S5I2_9MICC|nr:ABC transporter substrate-binding protein [Arthrobacter gengyunqii]MCC3267011.1 ABC transporter substrate-binding protein [Arthrobacter gengyunqii]MCC3267792.1 ABC transporter substrate-binding protein [Arthrobacter gengyunqii]UOY95223.1 ABC transporter substrate-binding protein [Arthrobacter gengyunqii]
MSYAGRSTSGSRPKRRAAAITTGIALSALILSGCAQSEREEGTGDAAASSDVDGTFVFAASSDPKSLDPAFASDGESFRVSRQIFEGLVGVKPGTADPEPLLAKSWETSEDALTYTFELQDGVTFHDGTDFNAEAVCANFDRWYNFTGIQQAESLAYYYSKLFKGFSDTPETATYESCEATGDTEAVVTLAKPFAGFIAALSLPAFSMQSPTAMDQYAANEASGTAEAPTLTEYAKSHPTGTGPFKFENWEVGNQITLSAYDDYWGEQGQVTDIIFRVIDDPNSRRQSLEAGTIDGYDLVAPADTKSLADAGYNVMAREPFTILYLGMNQKVEELANPLVRQAIAHAIDKQALVDQTLPEGTKVASQFIPDVVNGYNEDVTEYEYDPEKAKSLLAEAGYPDGFSVDFNYPTGVSRPYMPTPEQVYTNITAQLEEVGITVNPQPNKWSPDYLDRVQASEDHGIHLLGWTGDYNDTDNFVGVFFGGEKPEFGFNNPEIFDALEEARQVSSLEEQTPLYEQINEDIAEFVPAIPLAHPAPSLAFNERVVSYPASPVNDEVFNKIELNK